MKPRNYEQIRKRVLTFWGWLAALVLCAYAPLYLFFKSHQVQQRYIAGDIDAYRQILNKQLLLHPKIDSLYGLLQLLNVNAVRNDLFLEKYIADDKNAIIKLLGSDSNSFNQYAFLLKRMDEILALKDSIRTISEREQLSLKDLTDCITNTKKIQRELAYDPSRHFSSAH